MHMTEYMTDATRDGMRQKGLEPQYWQREWDDPAAAVRLWSDVMYPPLFHQLSTDTKRYAFGAFAENAPELAAKGWNVRGQWFKKRYFLPPPPMQTGEMARANLYVVTAPRNRS